MSPEAVREAGGRFAGDHLDVPTDRGSNDPSCEGRGPRYVGRCIVIAPNGQRSAHRLQPVQASGS